LLAEPRVLLVLLLILWEVAAQIVQQVARVIIRPVGLTEV